MPKESLKDKGICNTILVPKVHGNVLDLGLSNIRTVVVEDLAALPKATVLDLSNNVIATLPDSFCSLTHLVKIDLSKNSLTELPDNFGNLWNLQHLDLLDNKLSVLPLSFSRLDKLEWLDLKDNPLEVELKKNAGDCKNEAQCRRCAQNILKYMKEKAQKERGKSGLCLKMVVTIILTIIFMTGMIYIIQVYCDREKKISSANTMVKLSLMRAMH